MKTHMHGKNGTIHFIHRALACLFLAGALLAAWGCSQARAADAMATLKRVTGDVKIRANQTAEWQVAKVGDTLAQGAQVRTGGEGEALLVWPQGHVVRIFNLTVMTINNQETGTDEKTELNVGVGKIFSKVNKLKSANSTFSVKTPTAVAGVRGTDFLVEVSADATTKFTLIDGQLDIVGETVQLLLEQNTAIEIGKEMTEPPVPVEISPEVRTELEGISNDMSSEIMGGTGAVENPVDDSQIIEENAGDSIEGVNNANQAGPQEEINLPPMPPGY